MTITYRNAKGQAITEAEYDETVRHLYEHDDGVIVPKETGVGVKVDPSDPQFGWEDLKSDIVLTGAASDPSFVAYIGNITQMQMGIGDAVNINFHLPHDYLEGSDIFIHIHWSHNSATVTGGTVAGFFEASYAKGHDQAAFGAPVVLNLTNVPASTIRYQHMVTEGQLSASGGAGGLLVTEDLEVDGLILCRLEMTGNTMDGGAIPFIHQIDIHYQSTGIGTKQKDPDFYRT